MQRQAEGEGRAGTRHRTQADRAALYAKAQEIAKEEAPWITIAHSVRFDPIRKEVTGYKMDATAHHYFNKVDMPDK